MARIRFRGWKNVSMQKVVKKLIRTILILFISGVTLEFIGVAMINTCSPFYKGLTLIGWTVGSGACDTTGATNANTLTATASGGVLTVVGIIAMGSIVLEFIRFG